MQPMRKNKTNNVQDPNGAIDGLVAAKQLLEAIMNVILAKGIVGSTAVEKASAVVEILVHMGLLERGAIGDTKANVFTVHGFCEAIVSDIKMKACTLKKKKSAPKVCKITPEEEEAVIEELEKLMGERSDILSILDGDKNPFEEKIIKNCVSTTKIRTKFTHKVKNIEVCFKPDLFYDDHVSGQGTDVLKCCINQTYDDYVLGVIHDDSGGRGALPRCAPFLPQVRISAIKCCQRESELPLVW